MDVGENVKIQTPENIPSHGESLSDLKNYIKDGLFFLDDMHKEYEFNLDSINKTLGLIEKKIIQLEKGHPDDSDIFMFRKMYEDLRGDADSLEKSRVSPTEFNRKYISNIERWKKEITHYLNVNRGIILKEAETHFPAGQKQHLIDSLNADINLFIGDMESALNDIGTNLNANKDKPIAEQIAVLNELLNKHMKRGWPFKGLSPYEFVLSADMAEKSGDLKINRAYDEIIKGMKAEVERTGVKKEASDGFSLGETVASLRALGIQPEYVVTQRNPKAHTIVLFKQIHSNPGITKELRDAVGITGSQAEIKEAIGKALDSNLIDTVFGEGYPAKEAITPEMAKGALQKIGVDSFSEIVLERGNSVHAVGYETIGSKKKNITQIFSEYLMYRATAFNIMIASSVAESVAVSEKPISFMLIGAAHEFFDWTKEKNPVPISEALAYYGMNVVVVDASEYFNPEVTQKRAEELGKIDGKLFGKKE